MKLFHSLDTKIFQKRYKDYCDIHGVENVYAFRKSKLYLWMKVMPRFLVALGLVGIIIYIFFSIFDSELSVWHIVGIILSILMTILLNINTLKRYLDYKCDFVIITPIDIVMFDQLGLFKRNIRSISREKINSITTERAGFIPNIFNVGTLIILLQGGNENSEIIVPYIYQPDKTRQHIMSIIAKPLEGE